jgi:hypothetical protein
MTEKKSRFHFWDRSKDKGKKQLDIDEESLREFEAVLHAELEAEDVEFEGDELVEDQPEESVTDPEIEEENLEELEMEVERVRELQPESVQKSMQASSEESLGESIVDVKEQKSQNESLPVRTPLEDSLQEQLEELKQIKSGLPVDRREWIHEQAVLGVKKNNSEIHYHRRRRQQPKQSIGKWILVLAIVLCGAGMWFFRGNISDILPKFDRTEAVDIQDPEALLRTRVELFFSTAKVIEAESMTSFFSMTTMDDPQNYEANRDAINALIDLKTSFELVQELQYVGILDLSIEEVDGQPIRALVKIQMNSVDPVLKKALAENLWRYQDGQWVFDTEDYLLKLSNAQIAEGQVPIQTVEDHSDLPAGEVIVEEPVVEEPELDLPESPQVEEETENGFIQSGGFTYETEDERSYSMLTLKFGIQREGFEKMVFTSMEAKADQGVDAPSFQLWLSEDNQKMTVKVDSELDQMEIADYTRFSAIIRNIEVDEESGTLVFTFDRPTQVRPYEWKGLLIIDYEERQ